MSCQTFILHKRHEKLLELLNYEQRGKLFTAVFAYAGGENQPDIDDPLIKMAFMVISEQMDFDKEEYDKKCKKNAQNAAKRWRNVPDANVCDGISEDATAYDRMRDDANVCDRMRDDAKPSLSYSESRSYSDPYSYSDSYSESYMRESESRAHAREERTNTPVETVETVENEAIETAVENETIVETVENSTERENEAYGETRLAQGETGLSHSQEKNKKEYLLPLRGRYENVRLTAFDEATLKLEFPDDLDRRIERLSEYIATHGDKYYNHAAVIRSWAKNGRDIIVGKPTSVTRSPPTSSAAVSDTDDYEGNEYMEAAMARSRRYLERMEMSG